MKRRQMMAVCAAAAAVFVAALGGTTWAQGKPARGPYKPTIDDWVGVNAAVSNYTLGVELNDPAVFDRAFWPEATMVIVPEQGKSMTLPYKQGAPKPPSASGASGTANVIGTDIPPWHLSLNHHFEFQSATRATHYGYFLSVYPDLKTKTTTVGLPGHYADVLEKRNGEWRMLQRSVVIGAK